MIMVNYCYFDSIAQYPGVLRNVQGQDWPLWKIFESIAQCLNVLRNVCVYYAMSGVKVYLYEINPKATMPMCSEQNVLKNVQPVLKMEMKMKMENLYKT